MKEMMTWAGEQYEKAGIGIAKALKTLGEIPISLHCWQGGDEAGFEPGAPDTPGRLATPEEFQQGFTRAIACIPGKKRLSLLSTYALPIDDGYRDRDALEPRQVDGWLDFARETGIGLDFSSTFICHPLSRERLTLSHPDEKIRGFWVEHGRAARRIAAYIADKTGDTVLHNIWIPDGFRQEPADRLSPRLRLRDSLDAILEEKHFGVVDTLESKVFCAGLECATVGSHDFYLAYAMGRGDVYPLLDNGHFHAGEDTSDKISALLPFFSHIPIHLSRAVRWDSEHTLVLDGELQNMADAIVSCGALHQAMIGLDYYDPAFPRAASWALAGRSAEKALLRALLIPWETLKELQTEGDYAQLAVRWEQYRALPWQVVWDAYCEAQGVPGEAEWARRFFG